MKKKCLLSLLIFILIFFSRQQLVAGEWVPINSSAPSKPVVTVLNSNITTTQLHFTLSGFVKNEIRSESAFRISCPGMSEILNPGAPDLSSYSTSVIIPDQGEMNVIITASSYIEYSNINIAPSKGNLLRTVNPSDIPYRYSDVYNKNAFWPAENVNLRKAFILRDYRGQTVVFNPFQYNPVTKVLRVYYDLSVEVKKINSTNGINQITRKNFPEKIDREFSEIYKSIFINLPSVQYTPLDEDGNLLIICNGAWMSLMQPLVDWKIRKGIHTDIVDVATAGGTAQAIQSYIANYYAANNLKYVLLVGDVAQVPTLNAQGGASDPSYGYLAGNDSYAEVFVGRFSAESPADVITQVQRVINYEEFPDTSQSWFNKGVVIGSNLGPGDDNEMDWEHEANIRTDLVGFTYSNVAELYDGTHPTTTDAPGDPTNMDLFNLFQSGIGYMSYTGHGNSTGVGTTGFSTNEVLSLTNHNKLPFIWSVACENGDFTQTSGPCFAETFLRQQDNGQPGGAIAAFMSSVNQSWNPPMDAQDEMVDILVQSYANNIKRTFGGLSVNGCMHMNDQYGIAGDEMTDTWHCFGDPTLNVWTAVPTAMVVSHAPTVPLGINSLTVNCSYNGAVVSLTMHGQIISTGIVSGGIANMNFNPISSLDTLFVTVTGFNQVPYLGQILVIPATGPYVIYQSNNHHEYFGNNDGLVDDNEGINVDISLENLGATTANNVTAVLSATDPYITINNSSAFFPVINSNAIVTSANAYSYLVADSIPDQHNVLFTITCTDANSNSWSTNFNQIINAPKLVAGNLIINDSVGGNNNGILEAGESGFIAVRCFNNGHADAYLSHADLSSTSPYVTIGTSSVVIGTINKQSYYDVTFPVSIANNISTGTAYDLTININSGKYFGTKIYYESAGLVVEDFETNSLSKYNWVTAGDMPWLTTNYQPFEGSYCAVSGDINDSQTSELLLTVDVLADDSVNYWYKVSSEQGWDFFRFYIDGVQQDEQSGIIPWMYAGAPVTSGIHTLKFSYEKDSYYSANMDCAWLDNIKLPPGSAVTGIASFNSQNGYAVYPNPASSTTTIRFNQKHTSDVVISVLDVNGKLINSFFHQNVGAGEQAVSIPVDKLSDGFYFVKISSDENVKTLKLNIIR